MKRKSVVSVAERGWAKTVFKFADGTTLTLTPKDLKREVMEAAAVHGLVQKVVDAAAMSRDPDTGQPATVAEKLAACREVFERLVAGGPWNVRASGPRGVLFLALCEFFAGKKTPDEVRAWLATKKPADREALKRNPKIKPIVARLESEAVSDEAIAASDEMLDELEESGDEGEEEGEETPE